MYKKTPQCGASKKSCLCGRMPQQSKQTIQKCFQVHPLQVSVEVHGAQTLGQLGPVVLATHNQGLQLAHVPHAEIVAKQAQARNAAALGVRVA